MAGMTWNSTGQGEGLDEGFDRTSNVCLVTRCLKPEHTAAV